MKGLGAFLVDEVVALAESQVDEVRALEAVRVFPDGGLQPATVTVARADLVPYSGVRLRRMLGRV